MPQNCLTLIIGKHCSHYICIWAVFTTPNWSIKNILAALGPVELGFKVQNWNSDTESDVSSIATSLSKTRAPAANRLPLSLLGFSLCGCNELSTEVTLAIPPAEFAMYPAFNLVELVSLAESASCVGDSS